MSGCDSCGGSTMKNQQVNVDVSLMISTALVYLGLAISGWILLRLIQACFWLPGYLKDQNEKEELSRRSSLEESGKEDNNEEEKKEEAEVDESKKDV